MKCYPKISQLRGALLFFMILVACVSLPDCARGKRQAAQSSYGPRFAGQIEFVNGDAGFVLIDTGSSGWVAEIGTILITRDLNGGETARLKVTAERKGPFVTADITNGKPNTGDKVYQ